MKENFSDMKKDLQTLIGKFESRKKCVQEMLDAIEEYETQKESLESTLALERKSTEIMRKFAELMADNWGLEDG